MDIGLKLLMSLIDLDLSFFIGKSYFEQNHQKRQNIQNLKFGLTISVNLKYFPK
jgi:hypothetical protein